MDYKYRITKWEEFQHYKERNPPWIKLHFETLSSNTWVTLDDASRVLAVACMLIASRNEGMIPSDESYIQRVAYLNKKPNFSPLISCGFLEMLADASACKRMLADASASVSVSVSSSLSEKGGVGGKVKLSLDELSVDHISEWLAKKREEGRYLSHNEYFILDQFKQYCQAKGKKYANYIAGYQNAFEWDKCQPKQARGGDPATNAYNAAQSIIARRNAAARINQSSESTDISSTTNIRLPENIC